jgi:HK97 family phage major capsid protein
MDEIKSLVESFTGFQNELKVTLDKQAQEIKAYGATSTETAAQIETLRSEMKEVQAEMTKMARPTNGTSTNATVGARFLASDQYAEMIAGNRTSSGTFEVGSFHNLSHTDSPGVAAPHRVPGIVTPAQRTLRIRDLLNVQPTASNSIEFIVEKGFTNNAAPQVEGQQKAQSAISYEMKAANVQTIAHWVPATRQILADAGQLRAAVDGRLTYGLGLEEDAQILFGTGVGENLGGIMTNPDIQSYAQAEGETKIDAIRRAITLARKAEYPVSAILLSPDDLEDIELTKDTTGQYVAITVADGGEARMFRIPVVESNAMPAGECLVGAFGLGAVLYDRESANVRVSDSHGEFFTSNKVAILAEERVALAVERPESFVKVTFA